MNSILQVGHPCLRQKARPLSSEEILHEDTKSLVATMCEVMRSAPGVGLAAPQIGVALQIIVMEDRPEYTESASREQLKLKVRSPFPLQVLFNPTIVETNEEVVEFFEGCLSVRELFGVVPRFLQIKVAALNEDAKPIVIKARGWYARILQHEIDHLNGILCTDRMKINTLTTVENYIKYSS